MHLHCGNNESNTSRKLPTLSSKSLKGGKKAGGKSDNSSSLEDLFIYFIYLCELVEPQTEELSDSIIVLQALSKTNDLGTTADWKRRFKEHMLGPITEP